MQNNSWYSDKDISTLLKYYLTDVQISTVVCLQTLDTTLTSIANNNHNKTTTVGHEKHIIIFCINAITKEMKSSIDDTSIDTNHWVGLYIDSNTQQVQYLDTMGYNIDNTIKDKIEQYFNDNITTPLLNKGIQYTQCINDIELTGNTDDCGPMLVYALNCIHTNKALYDIGNLPQSNALGICLRESFNERMDFNDILQKVPQLFDPVATISDMEIKTQQQWDILSITWLFQQKRIYAQIHQNNTLDTKIIALKLSDDTLNAINTFYNSLEKILFKNVITKITQHIEESSRLQKQHTPLLSDINEDSVSNVISQCHNLSNDFNHLDDTNNTIYVDTNNLSILSQIIWCKILMNLHQQERDLYTKASQDFDANATLLERYWYSNDMDMSTVKMLHTNFNKMELNKQIQGCLVRFYAGMISELVINDQYEDLLQFAKSSIEDHSFGDYGARMFLYVLLIHVSCVNQADWMLGMMFQPLQPRITNKFNVDIFKSNKYKELCIEIAQPICTTPIVALNIFHMLIDDAIYFITHGYRYSIPQLISISEQFMSLVQQDCFLLITQHLQKNSQDFKTLCIRVSKVIEYNAKCPDNDEKSALSILYNALNNNANEQNANEQICMTNEQLQTLFKIAITNIKSSLMYACIFSVMKHCQELNYTTVLLAKAMFDEKDFVQYQLQCFVKHLGGFIENIDDNVEI